MKAATTLLLKSLLYSSSSKCANISLIGDTVDAGIYRNDDIDFTNNRTRILGFGLDGPFEVAFGNSDQKQYS